MIMTYENFIRGALMFLVALALTFITLAMAPVMADEDRDAAVRKALVDRTGTFCKAVLPAWFASERGVDDPAVRATIVDCYAGQARLTLLGTKDGLNLEDAGLAELPAVLLAKKTGMSLDIYRPLAGRTIRVELPEK